VRRGAGLAARLVPATSAEAAAWCRGAAGRALLDLRTFRHTGEAAARVRATASLDTALRLARAGLSGTAPVAALSLCHGVAGVADVALLGEQLLDEPALRSTAWDAVVAVRDRPDAPAWDGPGLLLGLAGVILLYLRLYDPWLAVTPFLGAVADLRQAPRRSDVHP
jgi:hypothetical protein